MKKGEQRNEIDVKFGKILHDSRTKMNLTQEFIAELFDISAHTLRSIEQGKTECSWVLFVELCVLLNIDLNKFAEENIKEIVTNNLDDFCLNPNKPNQMS